MPAEGIVAVGHTEVVRIEAGRIHPVVEVHLRNNPGST